METIKARYKKYFEYSCTLNPDTFITNFLYGCMTGQGTSKSAVTMMTAAATAATSDTQKLSLLHWRRCLLAFLLIFAARRLCRGATHACALVFSSSRLLAGGCWVCCRWLLGGAYSSFATLHTPEPQTGASDIMSDHENHRPRCVQCGESCLHHTFPSFSSSSVRLRAGATPHVPLLCLQPALSALPSEISCLSSSLWEPLFRALTCPPCCSGWCWVLVEVKGRGGQWGRARGRMGDKTGHRWAVARATGAQRLIPRAELVCRRGQCSCRSLGRWRPAWAPRAARASPRS